MLSVQEGLIRLSCDGVWEPDRAKRGKVLNIAPIEEKIKGSLVTCDSRSMSHLDREIKKFKGFLEWTFGQIIYKIIDLSSDNIH